MENSLAFLLILNPKQLPVDERGIRDYLYDIGYHDIQSYTAFNKTLTECEGRHAEISLVVWRFSEDDWLSDEKIKSIFGRNVHVEYRCRCAVCQTVRAKIEHAYNHLHDREFPCECITEEEKV